MGIADDVLKSEATGSWAGKAVPQQATYCILEQWLSDLICDVDRVIERLVEINFGPGHQYEITTRPLADQMLAQQNSPAQSANAPAKGDPSHAPSTGAPQPGTRMQMGADEGQDWFRMAWDPNQPRAPIGGVQINGKFFDGGQFIPLEDFEKASEEERQVYDQLHLQQSAYDDEPGGAIGPATPEQFAASKAKRKLVQGGRIEGYEETFDNFTQEELDRLNELAKQAWGMRVNDPAIRGDGAAKNLDGILERALGRPPKRESGKEWPYQKQARETERLRKNREDNQRLTNSVPKREITKGVHSPRSLVVINGMYFSGNRFIPPEKLALATPLERRILARALREEGRIDEIPPGFDYVEPPEELLPGLTKGLIPDNVGVDFFEPSYGTDAWLVWYAYHSGHSEHPQDGASVLKQHVIASFEGAKFTAEQFHDRVLEFVLESRSAAMEREAANGSRVIPTPGTMAYQQMIEEDDFTKKILAK